MDTYSTFEWDILADSPWSTLAMSYNPDFSSESHHAFQQSVQGSMAQDFPTASKQDINIPGGVAEEDNDSGDGASICSEQCSQVSCIDCCSETVCQPECLTPCENPDACEVPEGCAITACADSTCLVELPICSNDTCNSPPIATNWQAWQDPFLVDLHESHDHNMLSTPGGPEAYPSTALDCYRIIQGLRLHVYGFCSPRNIHQAVINHIGTYHGQRVAQYLGANPELLPIPYMCSPGVDQGCRGGFVHAPTAPALSIMSFSTGSEHTPPIAFTSELRRKNSYSPLAGGFNHSGLASTSIDVAASPKKRRKVTHPTHDDLYHYNEILSTRYETSYTPFSYESNVNQLKRNYLDSSYSASVSNYHVLEHGGFEAKQQRYPEEHTHGQHDREQNYDEQHNRKPCTTSRETQELDAPEQHACMWLLNHISGATCDTTFSSARLLQDHVDNVHVNDPTSPGGLQCQWQHCQRNGKPFEQKLKLMRHVFSHTKGKTRTLLLKIAQSDQASTCPRQEILL